MKIKEELKKKLLKEKENVEKQLKKFATKDQNLKDDWDTRFPLFGGDKSGSIALEEGADEVEEYNTLLPIEHSLELYLRDINLALKKIETEKYGFCEKCGKEISIERLKAYPEVRFCLECQD